MIETKHGQKIALIGLDGSGKSANIAYMKQAKAYEGFSFLWVRWEPKLLKPAYLLMQRRMKHSAVPKAEEKKPSQKNSREQQALQSEYRQKSSMKAKIFRNPMIRRSWMTLALTDYLVQFYKKTYSVLSQDKNIVFDRFYLDLFIDQGINFGFTPEQIAAEIHKNQKLFPKVDKMIYLRVSPEVCYMRKDDIPSMDYLERRFEIYEYLSQHDGWLVVDGQMPFQDVCNVIQNLVFSE